jgi:tetratricopeptide (TPR) repeat protein
LIDSLYSSPVLQRPENAQQGRALDRTDVLFTLLLSLVAFLSGCVQMFDTDVWWHLRTGEWILGERRVPAVDLFTFTSADRPWIDLHWGFQVALAIAHRLGGVPGMVLMASAVCMSAFLIGFTARQTGWPKWVCAWCWVPALLLMSTRFDPRPECFSLLLTAALFALLLRVERHPAWAWTLPLLMVVWVNVHALFALGLFVIAAYVSAEVLAGVMARRTSSDPERCNWTARWRHLVPAAVLSVLACLINPYGWRGWRFPLELFPKIADPSSAYKEYISEFMSLRARIALSGVAEMSGRIYVQTHVFLLLVLPLSFLVPSVWRRAQRDANGAFQGSAAWIGWFMVTVGLALADVIGLPGRSVPGWFVDVGRAVPGIFALAGIGVAAWLWRRSRGAAGLAVVGSLALAIWADWLRGYLFGGHLAMVDWQTGPGRVGLACAGLGFGLPALVWATRDGAPPFRILVAVMFGYLGVAADRNSNLFGLVSGIVLTWNVGEWAGAIHHDRHGAIVARAALAALLAMWLGLLVTDRLHEITGYKLHFGLRERPLTYAHNAARFAGQAGMPARALVFDVGQTGVYIYHNGPARKLFMDARLEVPSLTTFLAYQQLEAALNQGNPRALRTAREMGDMLILLEHLSNPGAEAALLLDRYWRCVYFDDVASVFVPDGTAQYAGVDFGARHFATARAIGASIDPESAYAEARALIGLCPTLNRAAESGRPRRMGAALLAADRARRVIAARPGSGAAWTLFGHCARYLDPDATERPPGPESAWDPARGIPIALSTFCCRQALALDKNDRAALLTLRDSFAGRGMTDAHRDIEHVSRPSATGQQRLPWPLAEQLAVRLLHLGEPDAARALWQNALKPPSPALRHARIGDTYLASFKLEEAAHSYQDAIAGDPELAVAWYGLSVARMFQGLATEALSASRTGLGLRGSESQQKALQTFEQLAASAPESQ